MSRRVAAIIPAAGLGVRMRPRAAAPAIPVGVVGSIEPVDRGSEESPKAFRLLAGRPLLAYSLDLLGPLVDEVVVAVPAAHVGSTELWVRSLGVSARIRVVEGGAERQNSVRAALSALSPGIELVLVHDAARPLMPSAVVSRVVATLQDGAGCVVPVVEMDDSVRLVRDGANDALDRQRVRRVQTPQGFRVDLLRRAHDQATGGAATDDATLVEALGEPVRLVAGDPLGFKVTRPLDLALAEAVLAARP